ncbi:MAG: tail fiber domain-containing protein [Glaciecola sp.]
MSFVGDVWDGLTGKTAARAAGEASDASLGFQREALDYLKQTQQPLLEAQQFGLGGLQDYYSGNQQGLIDQVQASPFYSSMIDQGEEAVLRGAAATGGLRSGDTYQALAQNSQNVLQSLVGQQLGGLGQMAGFQPNTGAVAGQIGNMGTTTAQGITGAAQARQDGIGNLMNLGLSAAGLFSDERLKDNIEQIGEVNGHNWYTWTWNKAAKALGLSGVSQGVIAQEVEQTAPHLIGERGGYKTVDYAGVL